MALNYDSSANSDDGSCAYPVCQLIDIPQGWFFFSTHIIPEDPSLESIFLNNLDNIIIIKNNFGNAFLPEWDFNGIGEISLGHGYQSKFSSFDTINICGEFAYPELNPINLEAGWNMIAYLRLVPSPIDLYLKR